MLEKKSAWFKVSELATNSGKAVVLAKAQGKPICLAKYKEKLFAFPPQCPHAGAPLEEGYTDVHGNIVCPLHGYKFSLRDGRDTLGEGYRLRIYPVESRPDGTFVWMEES